MANFGKPKIPAPFKRPSIDLGGQAPREWRTVRWDSLQTGDVVAQMGVVVSLIHHIPDAEPFGERTESTEVGRTEYEIGLPVPTRRVHLNGHMVQAYVKAHIG